ncbi:MAG: hypothetical protein IJA58_04370, partial [Lachnospiraceae bacterium]|nr:hypothetical protein [Lachnospiraceae bacterium]
MYKTRQELLELIRQKKTLNKRMSLWPRWMPLWPKWQHNFNSCAKTASQKLAIKTGLHAMLRSKCPPGSALFHFPEGICYPDFSALMQHITAIQHHRTVQKQHILI